MSSHKNNWRNVSSSRGQYGHGGKRPFSQRTHESTPPAVSSQHDELINYIYDSWTKVMRDYEVGKQNPETGAPSVMYYAEKERNPMLKDFRPFDLEAWWGQRLVKNITRTQSSSSSCSPPHSLTSSTASTSSSTS